MRAPLESIALGQQETYAGQPSMMFYSVLTSLIYNGENRRHRIEAMSASSQRSLPSETSVFAPG